MATTYEWESLGSEIMDSRNLIAVAEEIRDALAEYDDGDTSALEALPAEAEDEAEARALLAAIDALAEEGIEDWQYGATLIHEDHFTAYAEELADDIGAVNREASWPLTHIDWEAAAESLKQDYTEVDFRGTTYYAR